MTEWHQDDSERLRRLMERLDRDPSFSPEDAALIREMISVYRGLRAWGRGARFIVIALAALAAAATAWETIVEKARAWFAG